MDKLVILLADICRKLQIDVTVWVTVPCILVIVCVLLIAERRNNFPPLPGWFPVKPCFYQDFDLEIPVEFQHLVRTMYRLWQGE